MVYRRNKRYRRRRPYRRNRRRYRRTRKQSGSVNFRSRYNKKIGIPRSIYTKLRNVETYNWDGTTAGTIENNRFAGNGMGSSTAYLSELSQLYRKYVVFGSKVSFYWTPPNASSFNQYGQFLTVQAIASTGSDAFPSSYSNAIKQTSSRTVRLPPTYAATSKRPVLKMYRKTKYIEAVKDVIDNPNFSGTLGPTTQPSNQWEWTWTIGTTNGTDGVWGFMTVVRDFYVKFYDFRDSQAVN